MLFLTLATSGYMLKKMTKIGLGGKIAALTSTLVIATAAIVGFTFYSGSYEALIDEEIELLHKNTYQQEKQLQAIIENIRNEHNFISRLLSRHGAQHAGKDYTSPSIGSTEEYEHFLLEDLITNKMYSNKDIIRIDFFDYAHEATEVFSAYRANAKIKYEINYTLDTSALIQPNNTTTFSLAKKNNEHHLIASTTIYIDGGKPIHIRTAHNLKAAINTITHDSDERKESLFVTDKDGNNIYTTPGSTLQSSLQKNLIHQIYKETSPLFTDSDKKMITSVHEDTESGYVLHIHKTFLNKTSQTNPIFLGQIVPYHDLTYRTVEIRDKGTTASLILVTIAIVITLLFARLISQPIQQITLATRKFADGETSLSLPTKNNDEIGVLANSFQSMMKNIEIQKQNLINSENRTKAILNNTVDAVITANTTGVIETYNNAAEKIFGFSKEEAIGKNIDILIHPDTLPHHHDMYLERYSPNQSQSPAINTSRDLIAQKKNGTAFPIEISIGEIQLDDGHHFIAVIRDTTERKLSQEKTLRLAAAVEQSTEAIAITNTIGIIEYANPAYHTINKLSSSAVGETPFILQDSNAIIQDEVWTALSKHHSWKGQYSNHHSDNTSHTEEATITPIYDKNKLINYVIISRDISNEISMENELRQAHKMQAIGTLAGGIAHDFNNLLSGILGYAELTLEDLEDGSEASNNVKEMIKASERARDLVKQILTFSRQTPSQSTSIQPHLILEEVIKLLRASIPSSINLTTNIKNSDYYTSVSPTELHQVIMNICVNASHAIGHETGQINTSLDITEVDNHTSAPALIPGKYIHISISDSGHGIPPESIERIFEPFYTTKDVGKGTGMGLATAHGIITASKGTITVESIIGEGTTFHIFLPATRQLENGSSLASS